MAFNQDFVVFNSSDAIPKFYFGIANSSGFSYSLNCFGSEK